VCHHCRLSVLDTEPLPRLTPPLTLVPPPPPLSPPPLGQLGGGGGGAGAATDAVTATTVVALVVALATAALTVVAIMAAARAAAARCGRRHGRLAVLSAAAPDYRVLGAVCGPLRFSRRCRHDSGPHLSLTYLRHPNAMVLYTHERALTRAHSLNDSKKLSLCATLNSTTLRCRLH